MAKFMKKNALVAQSGGPTCVINATLAGVIEQSLKSKEINKIFGLIHGIEGVIEEQLIDLTEVFNNKERLKNLSITPGAALGSCRYKLESMHENSSEYDKIEALFSRYNVEYFFYIGGNDSMDTVEKLSTYLKKRGHSTKLIGIPKTIDNDLMETDHTPGFGSAAKYVSITMQEIIRDAIVYPDRSLTVVEIMGRDSGWLTAASALGRILGGDSPDLIYLPEIIFDINDCIKAIEKIMDKKKHVVVALAEGVKYSNGQYLGAHYKEIDKFGHVHLTGASRMLLHFVQKKLDCKCRAVELNIMQRCASHMVSDIDFHEAWIIGREAVKMALKGQSAKMAVFERLPSNIYNIRVKSVDIGSVANKIKSVDLQYINENGNNINDSLLEYIKPLVFNDKDKTTMGFSDYFKLENLSIK